MKNNITAGALRHRVTVQRLSNEVQTDANGGEVQVWEVVGSYWACIEPLDGRELVNAQQIVATVSHKVTMRDIGQLTSEDRLIYASRIFGIGRVLRKQEIHCFYELLCSEQIGSTQ